MTVELDRGVSPPLQRTPGEPAKEPVREAVRSPALKPVRERLRRLARPRGPARVVQPRPPHRRAEPRGPHRAAARLPLPQPVPRRADRRAGAEPAHAGRDHRRRGGRLRHRRHRLDHHRPRQAAAAPGRREPGPGRRQRARILHQSRARGAAAAPPRHADAHPRPHLRSRRLPRGRQPLALFARRHPALRPAAPRARTSRPSSSAPGTR